MMATSKFPLDFFDVPPSLVELAKSYEVYCNLRPDCREDLKKIASEGSELEKIILRFYAMYDGFWSEPINQYLKSLAKDTRVVLLLQGVNPDKLCVVTVLMKLVYWTSEGYPRLDFLRPEALTKMIGGSNIWGAFVIAIAPVNSRAKISGEIVSNENSFIDIVRKNGVSNGRDKKRQKVILKLPAFLSHPEFIANL